MDVCVSPLTELTHENFDEITNTKRIVVLYFWSEDCAPCDQFTPIYVTAAEQYPEVLFATINADEEEILCADFAVQALPTLIIIRQNVAIFYDTGVVSLAVLTDLVDQALAL